MEMLKAVWVTALFLGATGMAAEVDLSNIGLRLSTHAEGVLSKYGKKLDKDTKLVKGSVEIKSLTSEGEDLKKIHVEFNFEKTVAGKKPTYLHCEGDMIPEEGESDPSDVTLKLVDAGCER